MGSLGAGLPYWQVNVPEDERTEECPDFLRAVNAKDKGILSTPDEEYHVNTWPEVQKLILDNRLDLFQRVPSELRRYLEFNWKLKQEYGSVMNFILSQRLRWDVPLMPKGKPFECDEDIKILWNDWPYGLDKKIVHIVVWTKFDLEDDPATDDLTPKARTEIDAFVLKTFGSRVPSDHAVEHFHVMLYDPDPAFIDEITKGDVPLIQKV
ncbi:hypothetical protein NUW58_g2856 [Xylaria curta]|uniref:Uncharacterized protein n=1 Tax=Xylaria curta TaxID=42375 RepID=A0ACC1PE50_9PEZI|nr:hypothetical protein NUW58_g2856 [Xylaria curta]